MLLHTRQLHAHVCSLHQVQWTHCRLSLPKLCMGCTNTHFRRATCCRLVAAVKFLHKCNHHLLLFACCGLRCKDMQQANEQLQLSGFPHTECSFSHFAPLSSVVKDKHCVCDRLLVIVGATGAYGVLCLALMPPADSDMCMSSLYYNCASHQ